MYALYTKVSKFLLILITLICSMGSTESGAYCPPDDLAPNPAPVMKGKNRNCIVSSLVSLSWRERWSKTVTLEKNKRYWFAVSKCKRGVGIYAAVIDGGGKTIKYSKGWIRGKDGKLMPNVTGDNISFCFSVPKTGEYTILHVMGETIGGAATTQSCVSESRCIPEALPEQ
jgi:hypothetical protein